MDPKLKIQREVIVSPRKHLKTVSMSLNNSTRFNRLTCMVKTPCTEWFNEGESAAMVVFLPGSLKSGNKGSITSLYSQCWQQGNLSRRNYCMVFIDHRTRPTC
ncbi:ANM_collapsed_G0054080.mRNA.1.CDS.1 [Saccharomyces cerevisiae]|nr:ANM_collapsed_G0054080.mRNA.1.CDS.1 [Saccharomyces cerevisiae]